VIDRAVVLWSNPGEVVLTPFMGVGSEVYGAVGAGRVGIGAELKDTYYRQAVKNIASIHAEAQATQKELIDPLGVLDQEAEEDEDHRNLVSTSGRWLSKHR
jgi:hypothetical protein